MGDLRDIICASDRLRRRFGDLNRLSANEFHTLRCIASAEMNGQFLSAGELSAQVGVSDAAITYLVDRMTEAGHVRRDADPADGRKVILRCSEHGLEGIRGLRARLAAHTHRALAAVDDEDLDAAHRVFAALRIALGDYQHDLAELLTRTELTRDHQ